MNLIKQHIPNFCSGFDPIIVPFETTEDLLEIPFVKDFSASKKFDHYAINDNHLMCISDNGFHWWVIGTLIDPQEVNLPKWGGGKYRIINEACEVEVVSGEEVGGSRSGEVLIQRKISSTSGCSKWYPQYRGKN